MFRRKKSQYFPEQQLHLEKMLCYNEEKSRKNKGVLFYG